MGGCGGAAKPAPLGLRAGAMRAALLRWYRRHARPLPWRADRDPYRVWVAETMLQQTRIAAALPVYLRFFEAFPTLRHLAAAGEEEVLARWSGLGYYARARALHRAARRLVEGGEVTFPSDPARARALPGVGRYTAAAVLSIAYGQPHAAVDGNVARVLSRLFDLDRPDSKGEPHWTLAEDLLDRRRPGQWNEALMELGETVCTPRRPRCEVCPVAGFCEARAKGRADAWPPPRRQRPVERVPVRLWMVRDARGRLMLERGAFTHLPHLWLPPIRPLGDGAPASGTVAGRFRHPIVRRLFEVEVRCGRLCAAPPPAPQGERRRFTDEELAQIGRSSLLAKALRIEQAGAQ